MSEETYRCAACGREFAKARSDDEAENEALRDFGVPNAASDPEMAVVCDDCYRAMTRAAAG